MPPAYINRRSLLCAIATTAGLTLTGCGSGTSVAPYTLPVFAGGAPAYSLYHSYGDSITYGAALADPATQAYPVLVAKADGLTVANRAISGDQACDVSRSQIFAAAESPPLAAPGLYSLMISTNDANIRGPGPYEAVFNLCHQASIAWLAVPVEDKVLATSPVVATSGPVSLEGRGYWNALTTQAPGATISIPFSRAAAGSVYLWYRIQDGFTGTFSYALDGVPLGSGRAMTSPLIATSNGGVDSIALLRLPLIAAGSHVLTLQQTSNGAAGVGVVALGLAPSVRQTGMPLVLVGTTPKQLGGGRFICDENDAICQAYIADITANVSLLASDGLNVKLFNARKYLRGLPAEMSDVVHPSALGHVELAHSVPDVLHP